MIRSLARGRATFASLGIVVVAFCTSIPGVSPLRPGTFGFGLPAAFACAASYSSTPSSGSPLTISSQPLLMSPSSSRTTSGIRPGRCHSNSSPFTYRLRPSKPTYFASPSETALTLRAM